MTRTWYHTPVLLDEVLARLPEDLSTMMDGTLGHGGHSLSILETRHQKPENSPIKKIVWVDRDVVMLAKAKERLHDFGSQMSYVQGSYADFAKITSESWVQLFDAILLDIGVNMEHFKDGERGFSIKHDGPLDMRFDITHGIPASERLQTCTTNQFHTMLSNYTDFTQKWIGHLTQAFFLTPRVFSTTKEISAWANTVGMNDKTIAIFFQAIRIVVNGELDEFASFLTQFVDHLSPGGRCIILTYHSIEDRMAKVALKDLEDANKVAILTKHVIQPTWKEKQRNPASRSAKMRVVEKREK